MTNNTQLVCVPRELLARITKMTMFTLPDADYKELTGILATPAEDVRSVVEQTLDPVHGDVLPTIGSKVWIELGSSGWDEQTVTGYYVWPSHGLDKNVHRVFVRVKDAEGTPNARLLADVRTSAQAIPQ